MWNNGAELALAELGENAALVFLNNDLTIGEQFVSRLVGALQAPGYGAMSANYDGRGYGAPGAVMEVDGICAGRYDGTGGLAGFAFAVDGGWFSQAGYRFPEDCKWWFGDNDLVLSMRSAGGKVGIAIDATVEHEGAATAGDWSSDEWGEQLWADRAAFEAKWVAHLA
jgi:GT2 family glycosyltransferase